MNDAADTRASATESNLPSANDEDLKPAAVGADAVPDAPPATSPQRNGDGHNSNHVDGKSDSEAETVVLPGKGVGSSSPRHRTIKHEGNGDAKHALPVAENVKDNGIAREVNNSAQPDGSTSLKSRKIAKDQTATSSNLSSTKSSPAPDALTSSQADSEGVEAKGKPQPDSDALSRSSQSRKRKNQGEEVDEKSHKKRHRIEGNSENVAGITEVGERESRKTNSAGSESPPSRTRQRAQSIRDHNTGNPQKRKKPPPLHVGPRSRTQDDVDASSNGSASPQAPSHLKRLVSGDSAAATSPAKMPPHKKLRDRNGRTFLARLCDGNDAEAVRARIEERPEDIDIADYAGNTPLQIASLAGNHEIVKVLLDAGCKTDCKNVDQDTPLIDAVENSCLEVIKLLLDAGLDPRQSNAKGEQLMDLLDPEEEHYDEIRRLILKAQKSERRQSKESQHSHAAPDSASAHSVRDSSVHSPPPASASRRRTARSEATRNDLLWVTANRDNLREKARIGDDAAVDYILNVNPGAADTHAVLAAARGGHETSLSLLFAIGGNSIDADPDLLQGEKSSAGTPMLAAIGRGNTRVIELLLKQPGFNPARRWNQKTYHEISRERRGLRWEEEYRLLKEAYQKHKGISTNTDSPSSKKRQTEGSSSPAQSEQKTAQTAAPREGNVSKRSNTDVRRADTQTENGRGSPERSRQLTKKHLQIPSKTSSREHSVAVSDREATPPRKSSEKKVHRSMSDAEAQDADAPKPRKRLVSKRDLKDGSKQRRSSIVSAASSSGPERSKLQLEKEASQKIKIEDGADKLRSIRAEMPKKRPRPSTTSPESKSPDARRSPDDTKKTKKARVEGDSGPPKKADVSHPSQAKSTGKEKTASGRSQAPGTAGGSASTREKDMPKPTKSRAESQLSRSHKSPAPSASRSNPTSPPGKEGTRDNTPQRDTSDQLQREMQAAVDAERRKRKSLPADQDRPRKERKANEQPERDVTSHTSDSQRKELPERRGRSEDVEAERKAKAEREEAERKAKEKDTAEREAKAKQEEAERKVKAEQEEAERKAKAEKEEAERKALAEREEAERKAKAEREAEEARAEKQRQEEEAARKAAERERLRKEEEERQIRRRREQEERDRLAMERKQQEEEQRRREGLPRAIRRVAEMGPEKAKQHDNVEHWLPLVVAQGRQLDPTCEQSLKMEQWVSNLQVAPILGTSDIDLSQYTAWSKRIASDAERFALWRLLRVKLVRYDPPIELYDSSKDAALDNECHDLYDTLRNIFWIRMSDLLDIIPRYPHLTGLELRTKGIVVEGAIHPGEPLDSAAPISAAAVNGSSNGSSNGNGLPDGFH